jgi:hypothetical protein
VTDDIQLEETLLRDWRKQKLEIDAAKFDGEREG